MKTARQMLESAAEMSRKLGPYVLLELLLPGGTLFAFTLFLYRHPAAVRGYVGRARRAAARLFEKVRRAMWGRGTHPRRSAQAGVVETAIRA